MKKTITSIVCGLVLLFTSCSQILNMNEIENDSTANAVARASASTSKEYRNVIYSYSLSGVEYPEYYSHICIAFLKVQSDCSLSYSSSSFNASTIKNFKKNYPGVKVLASLGGGSDSATQGILKGIKKNMDQVVSNISRFVDERNLDGVDLDWEYFDDYDTCNPLYLEFAAKLRRAMPNKCITIAAQTGDNFYGNSDIQKMLKQYLDFVNIMTYDFDYSARSKKKLGFNGSFTNTKNIVQKYADIVGKENVNIGLPYYGIVASVNSKSVLNKGDSATSKFDSIDFAKIVNGGSVDDGKMTVPGIGISHAETPTTYHDNDGVAVYNDGSYVYVYDNSRTIRNKVEWALNYGVGGVMAWQASCDYKSTLQKVTYNVIKQYGKVGSPKNQPINTSGVFNYFDSKDSLPKVISSLDTSAKSGTFVLKSKYFKSYGYSTTNGGSLKLNSAPGRYTIDMYIRINNVPQGSSVFFDTRSGNSSTIDSISVLEELDNNGNVIKNLIPVDRTSYPVSNTGFTNIVSRTLTGTTGWIHIQYYGHNTTDVDSIYIDNLIISN